MLKDYFKTFEQGGFYFFLNETCETSVRIYYNTLYNFVNIIFLNIPVEMYFSLLMQILPLIILVYVYYYIYVCITV